jgi:Antitoxin Phd_YefM, type II toxin-antitoxin system
MKSITAKELKNRMGDVLRRVGIGEKVLVTTRGKPCAVLSLWKGIGLSGHNFVPTMKHGKDIQKPCKPQKRAIKTWRQAIQWSRRGDSPPLLTAMQLRWPLRGEWI